MKNSKIQKRRYSASAQTVRRWIKDYPELYFNDVKLFCKVCGVKLSYKQKNFITRHVTSKKHHTLKNGKCQQRFKQDLVKFLAGCKIPWQQVDNPEFREFIENCVDGEYVDVEIPKSGTLEKYYLTQCEMNRTLDRKKRREVEVSNTEPLDDSLTSISESETKMEYSDVALKVEAENIDDFNIKKEECLMYCTSEETITEDGIITETFDENYIKLENVKEETGECIVCHRNFSWDVWDDSCENPTCSDCLELKPKKKEYRKIRRSKMKRQSATSDTVLKWIKNYKELSFDGVDLLCKVCDTKLSYKQKNYVTGHVATKNT